MGRVPAPQGRNHHHRPVISFKERLTITALRFPSEQSLLHLLRCTDRRAGVAEISRVPKLPGTSNSRAPPHRPGLPNSGAARDESKLDPERPSSAAGRNSSFCQGTCGEPDPSKAGAKAVFRLTPI